MKPVDAPKFSPFAVYLATPGDAGDYSHVQRIGGAQSEKGAREVIREHSTRDTSLGGLVKPANRSGWRYYICACAIDVVAVVHK